MSGESRRTSSALGISGNIIMPREFDEAQNLECAHGFEASSQDCVGRQWRRSRAAQIAMIADVLRQQRAGCLFGGRRCFAVANDCEWVERDVGRGWGNTPDNCMHGQCKCRHRAHYLSDRRSHSFDRPRVPNLAWI